MTWQCDRQRSVLERNVLRPRQLDSRHLARKGWLEGEAYSAAPSCIEADGATTLFDDERATPRPYGGVCDVGAYEFDGDYIFADGAEVKL